MSDVALRLRGLSHRYGDVVALHAVDLDVRRGEVLALVGRNGAGKTTMIRLVAELLELQSGELTRNAGRVGYCPQDLVIWPDLTVGEQLEFVAQMQEIDDPNAIEAVAAELDLVDQLDVLAARLSGGLKRRLSIALATLHAPEVLVLDEPEVGLDPQSRRALREHLRRLADAGVAVVISSHSMDEVERLADRVVVLEDGRVVAEGTPADLAGDGRLEDRFLP